MYHVLVPKLLWRPISTDSEDATVESVAHIRKLRCHGQPPRIQEDLKKTHHPCSNYKQVKPMPPPPPSQGTAGTISSWRRWRWGVWHAGGSGGGGAPTAHASSRAPIRLTLLQVPNTTSANHPHITTYLRGRRIAALRYVGVALVSPNVCLPRLWGAPAAPEVFGEVGEGMAAHCGDSMTAIVAANHSSEDSEEFDLLVNSLAAGVAVLELLCACCAGLVPASKSNLLFCRHAHRAH